ncbi:MAG: 3-phosphoglycerate dehydrogenase, partial [Oscillospiraceae bacterium]
MFKVKTFNKISDVIRDYLTSEDYSLSSEFDEFDAAVVRSAPLHDVVLPERLLAIARAGAGVNNIPVDECAKRGIVVFNTPGANANAVKELVLCGMLLSGRKVVQGMEWLLTEGSKSDNVEAFVEKTKARFAGP